MCGKVLSKFLRSFVLLKEMSDLEKHTKYEMLSTTNRVRREKHRNLKTRRLEVLTVWCGLGLPDEPDGEQR